jgi:hypothetical protein
MRVKRRLKGRDQLLKLVEGQAGEIQELRGARLQWAEGGATFVDPRKG